MKLRLFASGKDSNGRSFWLGSPAIRRIRASELRGRRREIPFMVEDFLKGKRYDGLMLWPDLPYRVIADQQERFPQIVVEVGNS